jgi:hypothetical protein
MMQISLTVDGGEHCQYGVTSDFIIELGSFLLFPDLVEPTRDKIRSALLLQVEPEKIALMKKLNSSSKRRFSPSESPTSPPTDCFDLLVLEPELVNRVCD